MGGGQSRWWIKKRGCCWTIELAVCLNSSGQLRVSATRPPKPPPPSASVCPTVPLSRLPCLQPATKKRVRVGVWVGVCRRHGLCAFHKVHGQSVDQQGCNPMALSLRLRSSSNNLGRHKSSRRFKSWHLATSKIGTNCFNSNFGNE